MGASDIITIGTWLYGVGGTVLVLAGVILGGLYIGHKKNKKRIQELETTDKKHGELFNEHKNCIDLTKQELGFVKDGLTRVENGQNATNQKLDRLIDRLLK